jgi:hypothetical protein
MPNKLAAHVGNIDFADVPSHAAITSLSEKAQVNLDDGALEMPGLNSKAFPFGSIGSEPRGPADAVTVHLQNATLGTALDAVCDALSTPYVPVAVARDPAGILMLGMTFHGHRSVTTLSQFYDVDDLIGLGAPIGPKPGSQGSAEHVLLPNQATEELRSLAAALSPFDSQDDVGCFGRRLMVNGYVRAQENIAITLDHLRHPIRMNRATATPFSTRELPMVPVFHVPPTGMSAREALEMWEKAGAGNAVLDLGPGDEDLLSDVVGFDLRDATLEQIAEHIVGSPFIIIRPGEEDDRIYVRRYQREPTPRAYDVSAILAQDWVKDAQASGPSDPPIPKGSFLIDRISDMVAHPDQLDYRRSDVPLASCWKVILLLREDPTVHTRVRRYLEELQRTGRPDDPASRQ